MNRILLILLFIGMIPSSGIAQNNSRQPVEKPSTDACPSWNNKPSNSKADYFMYLRKSPKSSQTTEIARYNQKNKDFNKPVYTSLVPQKVVSVIEPPQSQQEEKSTNEINRSQMNDEVPATIPSIDIQTVQIKGSQPQLQSSEIIVEKKTEITEPANKIETELKKDPQAKKHKLLSFQNSERKHWLRKLKFRKKGAAKCPDF